MSVVYLNIESTSPPTIPPDPESVETPRNYKDPDTIRQYKIRRAMEIWKDLATKPHSANVIAISYAVDDGDPVVMMNVNEWLLFQQFDEIVHGLQDDLKYRKYVTFNGFGFDFPTMYARAVKYGLRNLAVEMRMRTKWGDDRHIDVFNVLGSEGSLDDWCLFFGINLDNPIRGSQVTESFLKQQHDLIYKHSLSRVIGAREIYRKLLAAGF